MPIRGQVSAPIDRLLTSLHEWVSAECERLALRRADFRFSRRQVRAVTGWGDTQLKIHLARLATLEYVLVHRVRSGQGYEYELLYDGEGETGDRFVMGLADPAAHVHDGQRSGAGPLQSANGRGAVAGWSAAGHGSDPPSTPSLTDTFHAEGREHAPERVTPSATAVLSYPQVAGEREG